MSESRKLIGAGRVSQVYLEDGDAYKVFKEGYLLEWCEYEVNVQNEIYEKTDLPVPQVALIPATKEIKMTYLAGRTLAERMQKEKYKQGLEDFISLQLSVYQYRDLDLNQAHAEFSRQLQESQLEQELIEKALVGLSKIPEKNIVSF